MEDILIHINKLYKTIHGIDWDDISKIPQSGGDRVYYRIIQGEQSWIATYNLNIKENETFIEFANHFFAKGLPVPKILAVSEDKSIYIQSDFGKRRQNGSCVFIVSEKPERFGEVANTRRRGAGL